jgi:type VI secretion system secreted protein VgrG
MPLLGRDTLVTGPVGDGVFLLETFQGKETLGIPYRYDLTLLSHDAEIPVDKVLGQSLTVHLRLPLGERVFNGIVTYFAKTGYAMNHARYAVVVNPKLSLFDYTRDCHIFFDSEAPDLVKEVLAKRGFSDVKVPLNGSYRKREYCVQYRETDLNFIQRLLEEDGIYYFFKHEDGKQTLVLADSATPHTTVPGYESILYLPKEHKMAIEEEHFWSLRVAGSLFPGDYTVVRGYDYQKHRATQVQFGKMPSQEPQPGADFEDYDYPGGFSEEPDAEEEASVRMQVDLVANTLIEVEGNTMGLGVGDLITLRKPLSISDDFNPFWSQADFKKEYIITSATYAISINQYESGDVAESDEPFKATYTLLDSQTQYRPQRTAVKPRIEGPQTALVVGPSGDEIYTDKFGRVKVQFDWDRLGKRNEDASCWVRVAQVWAGNKWGAIHIPRIGHEVMVEFLDGDPDRPIVTGRVYNTDCMPPYPLPDNKTQSGIKSHSSKGGSDSNFNEIRFEDLKGKEELHLQAEKDMSTLVKHNQSTSVGADRSVSVGGNHSVSVTGTQSTTVTKDETQTYKANRTMKVTGKNDDEVTDTHTANYKNTRTETVKTLDKLTVNGGDKIVEVHGKYDNTVDTEFKVTKSGTSLTVTDDCVLNATGKMDFHNPGTSVVGEGTKLALSGNAEVTITCGAASISLKSDGTIEITGQTVKIGNASNNAAFEPAGTTINGVKITSTATGIHQVGGALVKIG